MKKSEIRRMKRIGNRTAAVLIAAIFLGLNLLSGTDTRIKFHQANTLDGETFEQGL